METYSGVSDGLASVFRDPSDDVFHNETIDDSLNVLTFVKFGDWPIVNYTVTPRNFPFVTVEVENATYDFVMVREIDSQFLTLAGRTRRYGI